MRKIIVYVATSVDGYIARPDGDVGWLDRPRPPGNYGMAAFYRSVDTVVMGRKTYDLMLEFGQAGYARKANYVFSRTRRRGPSPDVTFVRGPVGRFARRLRAAAGGDVWLSGGAELIAAFLDAGEVDELIIHVVPTLIGEGIPLIAPRHRSVALTLRASRRYVDGVVRLHYAVSRRRSGGPEARNTRPRSAVT